MNTRAIRYVSLLVVVLWVFSPLAAHAAAQQGTEFSIPNPLGSNDFLGIITQVANALLALAIPVAVGMYIWAGVLYLTAGANPNNIKRAKDVLWYTTIGLVVIFIGGGFIDLIRSILNLGN